MTLRKKIREAIIKKTGRDPHDNFSYKSRDSKGYYEVSILWVSDEVEIIKITI